MSLRQVIRSSSLRQSEIAYRLGVSEASVSKWVNEKALVPTAYLRRLADMLEVTVDELVPREESDRASELPVAQEIAA